MEIIFLTMCALFIQACITGLIADKVGQYKNQKGFWWGFWLSILGIIIVACLPDNRAKDTSIGNNYDSKSKYDKLEQLQKLKDVKAITDEEFESEKSKILNQ